MVNAPQQTVRPVPGADQMQTLQRRRLQRKNHSGGPRLDTGPTARRAPPPNPRANPPPAREARRGARQLAGRARGPPKQNSSAKSRDARRSPIPTRSATSAASTIPLQVETDLHHIRPRRIVQTVKQQTLPATASADTPIPPPGRIDRKPPPGPEDNSIQSPLDPTPSPGTSDGVSPPASREAAVSGQQTQMPQQTSAASDSIVDPSCRVSAVRPMQRQTAVQAPRRSLPVRTNAFPKPPARRRTIPPSNARNPPPTPRGPSGPK